MDETKLEEMELTEPAQERDYGSEVQALFAARPELLGEELPEEVLQACVRGEPLTEAYNRFARARHAESKRLRQENRVLRENARSAAQAPVRGVSRGGSVVSRPEDPFLRGFNGWE